MVPPWAPSFTPRTIDQAVGSRRAEPGSAREALFPVPTAVHLAPFAGMTRIRFCGCVLSLDDEAPRFPQVTIHEWRESSLP